MFYCQKEHKFAVNIDMDMRQIVDKNELRKIQIDILDNVAEYCDNNNIIYSLSSGTLLGAIRHKGYIPWDDDIDLYMHRNDYNRFINKYCDSNNRYELKCQGSKKYLYTYAKVCDKHTLLIEDEVKGFELGVNIDIFPVDYVNDDIDKRKKLWWWKKKLYRIRRAKLQDTNFLDSRINYLCYRYVPVPLCVIDKIIHCLFQDNKPTNTMCNLTESGGRYDGCFSRECIEGTPVQVEFEGKIYNAMSGWEEYLKATYGDYLQLPPEDQRVTHHFLAYYLD